MHPVAERNATEYAAIADRVFGARLVGFYVVGSAAYDEFRPDRSDLDFVAVLDGVEADDCRRIGRTHLRSAVRTASRAFARGRFQGAGTCNGVFIASSDLTRPVTEIAPIGSHVGITRICGSGFDVNPVVWKTFAERGVALRGPAPASLGLDPQPELLRGWNLDNLNSYWRTVAERSSTGTAGRHSRPYSARWETAWIVLGTPRLHCTITTGDIVSKEQAGDYALGVFDAAWHPIIREALAYWRAESADPAFDDKAHRRRTTGRFGLHVIDAANVL
jgi:hypothetical protein